MKLFRSVIAKNVSFTVIYIDVRVFIFPAAPNSLTSFFKKKNKTVQCKNVKSNCVMKTRVCTKIQAALYETESLLAKTRRTKALPRDIVALQEKIAAKKSRSWASD